MPLFTKKGDSDVKYQQYDTKTLIPHYTPNVCKPKIETLVDYDKYSKLVRAIKDSGVSEEEKKFLLLAATRHLVFHYADIADYYAHADKEMQELMEQSALVILDINDAIANGYVTLSKDIKRILEQSGQIAGGSDDDT